MKKTKQKILRLIVFLSFIQLSSVLTAQVVPNIDWVQHYVWRDSTDNSSTTLDADNNVYVTGYAFSGVDRDLIVLKYDSLGTLLWSNTYDNGGDDVGTGIKVDITGNVFVCGTSYDATSQNDVVYFVYSSNGTQLSFVRYDAGFNLNDEAVDLKINNNGGDAFVIGTSDNGSNTDALVIKYNPGWSIDWANLYDSPYNSSDVGVALTLTSNNDIFCTGNAFNGSDNDIWVFMLDNSGSVYWNNFVTGNTSGDDLAQAIVTTGDNAVVCGQVYNTTTNEDYTTFRIDGSANIIWQQDYDNSNNWNFATSLVRDSTGNIGVTGLVMGGSGWEYHTIMYDSTGNQLWVNQEPTGLWGAIIEPRIAVDSVAHHFYVSGSKQNTTSDVMVYQITPFSGSTTWRQYHDGPAGGFDVGTGIAVSGLGIIYLSANEANTSWGYNQTTIRLSQTPVYFPIDFNNQTASNSHLYLKNEGQLVRTDSTLANEVLYYCPTSNPEIYLEKNAFNFVFSKIDTSITTIDTLERIQCRFLNSNPLTCDYNYNPKSHFYNFFLGYAASPAIPNLRANERVFIPNFYHLIDLHYYSCDEGIKYYFVCKPGAKPDAIILNIEGALNTYTTGSNTLFIDGYLGDVELTQPIAYQVDTLLQVDTLNAAYWDNISTDHYALQLPVYNSNLPLIIMVNKKTTLSSSAAASGNLDYSTYYGFTNNDVFNDVKVAPNGDRYIVGNTDGSSFPVTPGSAFPFYNAMRDAVLLKYSVIKDSLVFATYYGGAGDELGNSVDINSNGEIFIGGMTESSGTNGIPIQFVFSASNQTANGQAINPSGATLRDGFIAHFTPNGNALVWSRYYGGSQDDAINSIYVDNDNLFFTGYSRSNNITMVSAAQASISTGAATANADVILGKFNNLNTLVYSTYFGGGNSPFLSTQDIGRDITVDGSGNAIVVGHTDANNLPVNNSTGNSNTFYKTTLGGAQDGFIARYSPTGTKQFASYFGGSGTNRMDEISRVTYNSLKNEIYFAGRTNDTTAFPYVNLAGAFNLKNYVNINNTGEAFIASMLGDLTKQWCTNYGKYATCNFSVTGLTSDSAGIIYLAGQAKSNTLNYPASWPTLTVYEDSVRNADDGFVAVFTPQKNLYHAHYLGGTGNDYINNANVGANKKLYVVGQSGSTDYPIAYNNNNVPFIDSTFGGGSFDGTITRFDMTTIQVINVKETTQTESSLNVFPNPAVQGFMLQLKDTEIQNAYVKIYNLAGQLILEKKVTESQTTFSCESWTNGVYLINVSFNNQVQTFKLIKN